MGKLLGPNVSAFGNIPTGDQANSLVTGTITAIGPQAPLNLYGPFNVTLWANVNTALTTTALSLTASVASGSGLASGDAINSTLVPSGTTASVISGTTVTLAVPPITLTGDINPTDANVRNVNNTTGLLGATVTDLNGYIPSSTTVTKIVQAAIVPSGNNPGQQGIITLSHQPTPPAPISNYAMSFARNGNAITASGTDSSATFTGSGITPTGTTNLEKSFDGGSTWIVCQTYTTSTTTTYYNEPEKGVAYRLNNTIFSANIQYRISATGGAAMSISTPSPV